MSFNLGKENHDINYWSIALRYLIAVVLIGWLWNSGKIDFSNIRISHNNITYYLLALSFIIFAEILAVFRLKIILSIADAHINFKDLLKLTLIGYGFAVFLPGVLTGDIVKLLYISKYTESKFKAGVCVFLDRMFGLLGLLVISSIAFLINWDEVNNLHGISVYTSLLFVITILLHVGIIFLFILSRYKVNIKYLKNIFIFRKNLIFGLYVYILSLAVPILLAVSFYFIGFGLQADISFVEYFYAAPVILLSLAIPITPGGIGVGQVTADIVFSWMGVKSITSGADIVTLFQMMILCFSIAGIGVFFKNPQLRQSMKNDNK